MIKTFKDSVILRVKNGKLALCDYSGYDIYPNQEKIVLDVLKTTNTKEEIIEKLKEKNLNTIIIDDSFENDEYDYSMQLYDLIQEIIEKIDLDNSMDFEISWEVNNCSLDSDSSDMKAEMEIVKKEIDKYDKDKKKKFAKFNWEEVIYLKWEAAYYRPRISGIKYTRSEIATIYWLDPKDVRKLHIDLGVIQNYERLDYGKPEPGNYNLLNELSIMKPRMIEWKKYECPKLINFLIDNLANHEKEQYDYLNKLVLWKIKNPTSSKIPCVVLFWNWWAWKWLFTKLLKWIFWYKNVYNNIHKSKITSEFWITWEYLVAEFAEISQNNNKQDSDIGDRLKNLIWSDEFTVNRKWIQDYEVKNVVWFIISSNNLKPIKLDVGTGNRRYSIIKVWEKIDEELWQEIDENVVWNKKLVQQYVNWLEQEYGEQLPKVMKSLENQDKKDLENRSKNDIIVFWENIAEEYKKWEKVPVKEINQKFNDFCIENDVANYSKLKDFFWNDSPYTKSNNKIDWKSVYSVIIK